MFSGRWILVTAMIVAASSGAFAEDERAWTDKAEFSLVVTGGNSKSTVVSFSNQFVYKWTDSKLTIDASALKADTTSRTASNVDGTLSIAQVEEITAEKYLLGGKYDHKIHEGAFWYVLGQWGRDRLAGIDNRYNGGAGMGYRLVKTERQEVDSEVGFNFTKEEYAGAGTKSSATFGSARGFLGYKRKLSGTSELTSSLELLQNLDDPADLRAIFIAGISANINSHLALKVSYTINYDGQPVEQTLTAPGFDPVTFVFNTTDTILAASLLVNF